MRKGEAEQEVSKRLFFGGRQHVEPSPASAAQLQECCVGGPLRACRRQAGTADASAPQP